MALLHQRDARRDILIEPAARRGAAIEARGHSELWVFGNGGVRNWGRNRAVKTNRLVIIMVALWNRADHYIFILWFLLLLSFFSSPNLSRHRLDVCHTSTHGVALVRI